MPRWEGETWDGYEVLVQRTWGASRWCWRWEVTTPGGGRAEGVAMTERGARLHAYAYRQFFRALPDIERGE